MWHPSTLLTHLYLSSPIRLTNRCDSIPLKGLTGIEGVFRRTMEVCMSLLRENKDTLLGVLEPFIRDPTVSWGRTGRAQRGDDRGDKTDPGAIQDNDNADAKEALLKITERLNGIYNLIHPTGKQCASYHLTSSHLTSSPHVSSNLI